MTDIDANATEAEQRAAARARVAAFRDAAEPARARWRTRNPFFHAENARALRFLIPPGASVLAVGCADGAELAALAPARGLGIDPSVAAIEAAKAAHPGLEYRSLDFEVEGALESLGETFDFVLLPDTVGWMEDLEATLARLHAVCHPDTRVV
ncbi:MAG: methyltransferase, partial [Tagaea sp.]|nr:methyltransferase [Tagaea sp.]